MDDDTRAHALALTRDLESRGFATVDIANQADDVEFVRSAGRKAGRERGWRIRTLVSDLDPTTVRVHIMVTEADELHAQLWAARREKVMRRAINEL